MSHLAELCVYCETLLSEIDKICFGFSLTD